MNRLDYTIVDATLEDLDGIVAIYNSTIAGRMVTADTELVSVESRKPWFKEHSPDFRPLWVMKQGTEIIAWLSFQSFYGRPAYNGTAEVSIYVNEQCRGQGIGRILMEQALEGCERLNVKTLLGFIFGHNVPSLRLFEQFGFESWANLPRVAELDGVERDLIIMGKRVG